MRSVAEKQRTIDLGSREARARLATMVTRLLEHWQLTGDHVGHQACLVVEAAIDRRLADAGRLGDALDRHSREAALDQEREGGGRDRIIDTRVQCPHHQI